MTRRFELDCDDRAPANARRYLRDALAQGLEPVASSPSGQLGAGQLGAGQLGAGRLGAGRLGAGQLGARVADVELLVSELVSNAVLHGRCSRTEVRLDVVPPASLRVEVRDPGLGGEVEQRSAQFDGTGGLGLHLVQRLAARWGHDLTGGGRTVWFEIDLVGDDPAFRSPSSIEQPGLVAARDDLADADS